MVLPTNWGVQFCRDVHESQIILLFKIILVSKSTTKRFETFLYNCFDFYSNTE